MISSFQSPLQKIKTNPLTFLLIVVTAFLVLYIGYIHHTLKQAVVYLFVIWLCAFIIDLYSLKREIQNEFIVRNPKKETLIYFICLFLGLVFFYFRFSGKVDWPNLKGIVKLAIMPLVLFVFPVGLAIIMLVLKYKPRELGLKFNGLVLVIPIVAIFAITNRLLFPESLTWNKLMEETGGILGILYSGFIMAGLSEEFSKTIGQTRLGALLNNKGLGWFIVTVTWAFMHFPKWYSEEHNFTEAALGSIRIIPIGLLWGYLTHRTKSFLPATIVHGLNFWGLQNF